VRNKIPGLKGGLPAKLDVFGRESEMNNLGIPIDKTNIIEKVIKMTYGAVIPLPVSKATGDKIDHEIVRLKYSPDLPKKTIKVFKMDVLLDQSEYWDYVKISGTFALKELNKKVDSFMWTKLTDDQQKELIKNTFRKSRDKAKKIIWKKMSEGRKQEVRELFKTTKR